MKARKETEMYLWYSPLLLPVLVMTGWVFSAMALADNASAEDGISIPLCASASPPDYCRWSKQKRMAYEQEVIDRAILDIKRIILPYLKGATWVPAEQIWPWEQTTDGSDPADPVNRKACADRLAALREGRFMFFPEPQARSSMVGGQAIAYRLEQRRALQACPKERGKFLGWQNRSRDRHSPEYDLPYFLWYYERPQGQALVAISPVGNLVTHEFNEYDKLLIPFDIELENTLCGLESTIPTDVGFTSKRDLAMIEEYEFSEYAYGLIGIGEELFAVEGGGDGHGLERALEIQCLSIPPE